MFDKIYQAAFDDEFKKLAAKLMLKSKRFMTKQDLFTFNNRKKEKRKDGSGVPYSELSDLMGIAKRQSKIKRTFRRIKKARVL